MTLTEARKLCRHAAELLEERAEVMRRELICDDGKWLYEFSRAYHNDLLATARGLRELAQPKQSTKRGTK